MSWGWLDSNLWERGGRETLVIKALIHHTGVSQLSVSTFWNKGVELPPPAPFGISGHGRDAVSAKQVQMQQLQGPVLWRGSRQLYPFPAGTGCNCSAVSSQLERVIPPITAVPVGSLGSGVSHSTAVELAELLIQPNVATRQTCPPQLCCAVLTFPLQCCFPGWSLLP